MIDKEKYEKLGWKFTKEPWEGYFGKQYITLKFKSARMDKFHQYYEYSDLDDLEAKSIVYEICGENKKNAITRQVLEQLHKTIKGNPHPIKDWDAHVTITVDFKGDDEKSSYIT